MNSLSVMVLSNGSPVSFGLAGNCVQENGKCVSEWWYSGFTILVDTNGNNAPNTFGKDVFIMNYPLYGTYARKVVFNGVNVSLISLQDNCSKNGSGTYCGALIQHDNWEMKYDW